MPVELTALGDSAVIVQFESRIDRKINARVLALQHAVECAEAPGITFVVPAYCTLTVGFDPLVIDRQTLDQHLTDLVSAIEQEPIDDQRSLPKKISIPVCYDSQFAPDLESVVAQTGRSPEEIIELHTRPVYRVFMLGFLPGFAYLGATPEELACRRHETPRRQVPARSIAIAGRQTAIYPMVSPGGWQVIGRTPVAPFDPGAPDPFLLRPGDAVAFHSISPTQFDQLEHDT